MFHNDNFPDSICSPFRLLVLGELEVGPPEEAEDEGRVAVRRRDGLQQLHGLAAVVLPELLGGRPQLPHQPHQPVGRRLLDGERLRPQARLAHHRQVLLQGEKDR